MFLRALISSCIYLCAVMLYGPQAVSGSGRVHIQLRSYQNDEGRDRSGRCCDGLISSRPVCKPCDPFLFSCLLDKREHNQGHCISNNFISDAIDDAYRVNFPVQSGVYEFTLNFTIQSRFLDLSFVVYDEDKYDIPPSQAEIIDNTTYNVGLVTPLSFLQTPLLQEGNMSTTNARLIFGYYIQCDKDFYYKCDKQCPPDPEKYTCSSHGQRICNPGWNGINCTIFDFCSNQSCLNGGSCTSGSAGITCKCLQDFTGPLCDITITTTNSRMLTSTSQLLRSAGFPSPSTTILVRQDTTSTSSVISLRSSHPTITQFLNSVMGQKASTAYFSDMNTDFQTSTVGPVATAIISSPRVDKNNAVSQTRNEAPKEKEQLPKKVMIITGSSIGFLLLLTCTVYLLKRNQNRNRIEAD